MHRTRALHVLLSVTVVLTTVAGLVVVTDMVGIASADHDMIGNFTVNQQSPSDRQPGSSSAGAEVLVTSDGDIHPSNGLEKLEFIRTSSTDFDFDGCNQLDVRVFGLDKGNDNSGTQTDVNLLSKAEKVEFNEDEIFIDMVDSDDQAVAFETDDQLVAVLGGCIETPGDPGWYQVTGKLNGTRSNGSPAGVAQQSHYIAICDCESREQAVNKLGPPPSAKETPPPSFSMPDAEQRGNGTIVPASRQPGATTGYTVYATGNGEVNLNLDEVSRLVVYGEEVGFSACSSASVTEFGIDTGNDDSGLAVDESLTEHIQGSPYTSTDVFAADFWARSEPGPSTTLSSEDQVVFQAVDCVQNPSEPGWYTATVEVNGTNSGRQVSEGFRSRYFYICDCDSRSEAERKLGPPGQSGGTATPTATPGTGSTTPTATATPSDDPATPTRTAATTPTPTPTAASTPTSAATRTDPDSTRTRSPTATAAAGTQQRTASGQVQTPTIADGPGFGVLVTFLAMLGSALLAVRRGD